MPNWCFNQITFSGPEKPIKKLRDFIDKQRDMPNEAPRYHFETATWLGTFLSRAGFDPHEFECRGTIVSWPKDVDNLVGEKNLASFAIETESAWKPMIAMWQTIARTFSDRIKILYTSEEPGTGIYMTNDPVMRGWYHVNPYELDKEEKELLKDTIFAVEGQEIYSWKDVRRDLLKIYKNEFYLTTAQLVGRFCRDHKGVIVRKYELCSIEEVG